MKQFVKILKFELKSYLKNKIFVGITLFLALTIAIATFIPNILSAFESKEGDTTTPTDLPTMLLYAEDDELAASAKTFFASAFTGYQVKIAEGSIDEMKNEIVAGNASCAFVMNSASSYTYYVNNLSMYDNNTATANTVLQEVYRYQQMVHNNIPPETASDILSVQIESKTETLGKDQLQNVLYTYIMILSLYTIIMLYGQVVATNVATEKSSRAMELLVTSANPTSMMFGKVLSSCIAGFSQLVLIFGTATLFYNINKGALSHPVITSLFGIPFDLFIYLIVFFVLGFLIYAFLYGAIGSTASKLEDINTSTMPISFLYIIAFSVVMFSMSSGSIDNAAMIICSYVPFTSPMAMFTRICLGSVEWYEIAASIAILVGSTIGIGVLAAKIYRIGVLLYGTPPKIGTILKMVFQKQ